MPKPVCVPCGLFFRPERIGQVFEEGMPNGDPPIRYTAPDGTEWSSYKLWRGDKWTCRGCGTSIIVGVMGPNFAEHYQPDYAAVREAWGGDSIPFVHDC